MFLNCLYHRIASNNCNNVVSPVYAVFAILWWYSIKNEIPEVALELCQLKIKQFSPDILKFRKKNEDNPFTLICSVITRSFLLCSMQACVDWVLIIFGTQFIKKKRPVQTVFLGYLSVSYDYGAMKNIDHLQLAYEQMFFIFFRVFLTIEPKIFFITFSIRTVLKVIYCKCFPWYNL